MQKHVRFVRIGVSTSSSFDKGAPLITIKTRRMNSFAVKCFWYPSRLSYTCLGACQQVQDGRMLLKYFSLQLLAVFTRRYVFQLTAPFSPCVFTGASWTKINIINTLHSSDGQQASKPKNARGNTANRRLPRQHVQTAKDKESYSFLMTSKQM